MKFAKGAVKALEKKHENTTPKLELPVLTLILEEGEYNNNDCSKSGSFKLLSDPNNANSAKNQFWMGFQWFSIGTFPLTVGKECACQ